MKSQWEGRGGVVYMYITMFPLEEAFRIVSELGDSCKPSLISWNSDHQASIVSD